jgi:hypothetical protein
MANGSARIVLGLLGCETIHLTGRLRLSTFERRLAAITAELIAQHAKPARRISATEYDHGTPVPRLTGYFVALRALANTARQAAARSIAWG